MQSIQGIAIEDIKAGLADLDRISFDEYGDGLETLLRDGSSEGALRVQRVTGIALKRSFATQSEANPNSKTKARHSWPWKAESPETFATEAPREFAILDQLRMPGPWNERKSVATESDSKPIEWWQFKDDADNERGLFKVLALWADDKLKGREGKSFREYLEADESRNFEAGLELATLVFDASVTAPLASLIGIPTIVVGVALVGIRYGYRLATDTNQERVGDQRA